jgi:hypothetical protein
MQREPMMQIERIMKRYYQRKLREIPDAPRPERLSAVAAVRKNRFFSVSWEDVLGFIVTASYFLQFIMPDRWFVFGRIMSVFRIGF